LNNYSGAETYSKMAKPLLVTLPTSITGVIQTNDHLSRSSKADWMVGK
jgi:hypothetical protein